jgi:hypothetical protein
MPLRGWVLVGVLVAFTVAILAVLAWAGFSGRAGSQRGLVIHSQLASATSVHLAGQTKQITPDDEEIFVVKREQFPAEMTWSLGTDRLENEMISYDFLADADFRISIDENGVYKTSDYRDTPVPRSATEVP